MIRDGAKFRKKGEAVKRGVFIEGEEPAGDLGVLKVLYDGPRILTDCGPIKLNALFKLPRSRSKKAWSATLTERFRLARNCDSNPYEL
jgi:hypothetical protein